MPIMGIHDLSNFAQTWPIRPPNLLKIAVIATPRSGMQHRIRMRRPRGHGDGGLRWLRIRLSFLSILTLQHSSWLAGIRVIIVCVAPEPMLSCDGRRISGS